MCNTIAIYLNHRRNAVFQKRKTMKYSRILMNLNSHNLSINKKGLNMQDMAQKQAIENMGIVGYLVQAIEENLEQNNEQLTNWYSSASDVLNYAEAAGVEVSGKEAEDVLDKLRYNIIVGKTTYNEL